MGHSRAASKILAETIVFLDKDMGTIRMDKVDQNCANIKIAGSISSPYRETKKSLISQRRIFAARYGAKRMINTCFTGLQRDVGSYTVFRT